MLEYICECGWTGDTPLYTLSDNAICPECYLGKLECYTPMSDDEARQWGEVLRAAVVENVRRQGLITDEQAAELLREPIE